MTSEHRLTLMTVHAHPDDETIGVGGTMARAVADSRRVVLVTGTRGELGEIVVPEMDTPANHHRLGEIRAGELEAAMTELGVTEWENLGYRDSGMMGDTGNRDPRSYWQADLDEAIGRLVWFVRQVRPDVMTTYNDFGGYGHPDHIRTHLVAVGAFARAGDAKAYPGQLADGLEPWAPAKLYEQAMSRSQRDAMNERMIALGRRSFWLPPEDATPEQLAEHAAFIARATVPDDAITTRCSSASRAGERPGRCSSLGWPTVVAVRTGNAGAVRNLLMSADLAVANFENPAPDDFKYHTQGTVFSANPRLIAGLRDSGIDYVSLGNNHIGDAGPNGLLQTLANLDKYGIRHSGAGKNLAAARAPAIMTVDGVKGAILSYDTIAPRYAAGINRPGSAQLSAVAVKQDVAAARKVGAQLVSVYPHWGTEYSPRPFSAEQALAHAVIDAGAEMTIGNHAHWAGAIEISKGHSLWYAPRQFRVRPDLVRADERGPLARADVQRQQAHAGTTAADSDPRRRAAEPA